MKMTDRLKIKFLKEPSSERIRELLEQYFEGFSVVIREAENELGPGWMVTFPELPKMRWESGNEDPQAISVLMKAAHADEQFTAWACCPKPALDALARGFIQFVWNETVEEAVEREERDGHE